MERINEVAPPIVQSGPVGKELELAKELQSRVGSLMWNDQSRSPTAMMRWLTARKMDVDKAEKMVKNHLAWRKKWKMDDSRHKPANPELLPKFWYTMAGHARDGSPVMLMSFGEWDVRKYLASGGDHDKFYKHHSLMWEHALVAVEDVEKKTRGKRKTAVHYFCVCDMGKLQYAQLASVAAFQSVIEIAVNFEENYPEVIKYALMINSDWVFDMLIQLLRPFMRGSVEKLKALGEDRKKWEKAVRRYIDPKVLPYRYGGFKNDERAKMGLKPIPENGW